jgi:hyperosmotically inducible protein
MKTTPFYKVIFFPALMISGLLAGIAIGTAAVAAPDDTAKPQAHSDGVVATVSDTAITAKVKAKFAGDKILKGSDISVTTTNGVVTLDGTASNSKAKAHAEKIAVQVDDVKSVDNNLKTPTTNKTVEKTKEVVSDSWITTKIKSDILANSITKGFDVNVVTTDGVVVLKGTLANQDAIDHVKDIAGKVKGVKSVDTTELTVITK